MCNPVTLIFIADTVQQASSVSFGQGHLSAQTHKHTYSLPRWRLHKPAGWNAGSLRWWTFWNIHFCTPPPPTPQTHTLLHSLPFSLCTGRIVDAGSWFPTPESGVTVIYDWGKIQGKTAHYRMSKQREDEQGGENLKQRKRWRREVKNRDTQGVSWRTNLQVWKTSGCIRMLVLATDVEEGSYTQAGVFKRLTGTTMREISL